MILAHFYTKKNERLFSQTTPHYNKKIYDKSPNTDASFYSSSTYVLMFLYKYMTFF